MADAAETDRAMNLVVRGIFKISPSRFFGRGVESTPA